MTEPPHPYQKFYESWRLDVRYRENERTAALDRATQFALLGLKFALGVNGSAILSVPIFIELVGKNELWTPNSWQIALAVGAFGIGLLFATISIFFGYSGHAAIANEQSFRRDSSARTTIRDLVRNISKAPLDPNSEYETEAGQKISDADDQASKFLRSANFCVSVAEVFYGSSMICFLVGAVFFGFALSRALGLIGIDGLASCAPA